MRAYLSDELDHHELRASLLEGDSPVISSVLARLEFASATYAASRAQRLRDPTGLLARFDADCSRRGPLSLLVLRVDAVLPKAYEILGDHPVRTLDALHLAVALEDGIPLDDDAPLTFVTRDEAQAQAARSLGLAVL